MARKTTKSLQRKINPDRKYQSILVQRLINKSMLNGKKQVSERAVYTAIEHAAKSLKSENPVEVFEKALGNISPSFEVKSRRVGGANYQIPFPISGHRQLHFAFSWLVQAARSRSGAPYAKCLEQEIVDAYHETGTAFKKKEDTHRMAEANRAFAHFART
jgi:small subunit ribosomal protein S7